MKTFILILMFTFPILLITAFVINFCRRPLRGSKHPLTGMCHKDGGTMCCSCSDRVQPPGSTGDRH